MDAIRVHPGNTMNQNTCKTCKWWGSEGRPLRVMRQCLCPMDEESTGFKSDLLDAPDNYEPVWTGPDFGCIHYEETQEQLPQDHPGYAAQQIKRDIWPKQPCGHTGVLSIYPDKNGNGQCTACANEMRRLHPGEIFSVGL